MTNQCLGCGRTQPVEALSLSSLSGVVLCTDRQACLRADYERRDTKDIRTEKEEEGGSES